MHSGDARWIKAVNPRTGGLGKVPSNYLTREKGKSLALDAFHDVSRADVERWLQSDAYLKNFNYVLRPSTGKMRIIPLISQIVVHWLYQFKI